MNAPIGIRLPQPFLSARKLPSIRHLNVLRDQAAAEGAADRAQDASCQDTYLTGIMSSSKIGSYRRPTTSLGVSRYAKATPMYLYTELKLKTSLGQDRAYPCHTSAHPWASP